MYVPPLISQILDFIYGTVLILILIYFKWRDTENQQYIAKYSALADMLFLSFDSIKTIIIIIIIIIIIHRKIDLTPVQLGTSLPSTHAQIADATACGNQIGLSTISGQIFLRISRRKTVDIYKIKSKNGRRRSGEYNSFLKMPFLCIYKPSCGFDGLLFPRDI